MEGLFSEGLYTGGFTEAVCNNALLKSINELDSITNVDDYKSYNISRADITF